MSERTDYNHPSTGSLRSALAAAAALGRGSDSMLVHVNPREAAMLRRSGGTGARNPLTGLLEFDGGGDNYVGPPGQTGAGGGGYPVWQNSITDAPATGGGPDYLTSTSPGGFTPVAPGTSVPDYVSQYMVGANGGALTSAGKDTSQGTLGTFDVNGQTNYGWQFSDGSFAPAFLPTSGETNTSLNAQQQSALYPAPLAGETQQNQAGLPVAWTDTNNVLTPTAGTLSDAAYNLPGETRALNDTHGDPLAMLGLLGPALALGGIGAGALGLIGGGAAAGADAGAAAGAGAAADAGAGGIFDLGTLLGTSPAATTALATGDVSGLVAGGAGAAAGAGAGAAGSNIFDLGSLLGTDPATTSALATGDVSGLTGAGGLADAGTAASSLGLGGDNSIFLGAADQTAAVPGAAAPVVPGSSLPLTAPAVSAPSNLGAVGGDFGLGAAADPSSGVLGTGGAAGGGSSGGGGFLSGITDPVNSFVNSNSGLFKALGLGASALSLGGDLLKGNQGVTGLTGGSQLNTLAGQLAQPGGINPAQTTALTNLQNTATTQNQGPVNTLTALQGQAQSSGNTLQNYLNTGTLPPAVQAEVDQATQSAITAIKAGYASRGIPANSSMEQQDINTAKQNATAQAAQLMQSLSAEGLTEQQLAAAIGSQITSTNTQGTQLASQIGSQLISSGLSGAGISEQIYQTLLQADQNQQTQTGNAIANLAKALAGGTTIKLGGATAT